MCCRLSELSSKERVPVLFARTMWDRLRGLKAHKNLKGILVLMPCNDIHTFGMKRAIDVAFVSREGRILKSITNLAPNRRERCMPAVFVLERYVRNDPWPQEGCSINLGWIYELLNNTEAEVK